MNTDEASTAPLLSIALRGGGTVAVWPDRLSDAASAYPLAQIAGALLVADPTAPPLPNGMPMPAVQLRLADGRAPVFTPANPQDAYRLLDAIFGRRPDLRLPPPPPPMPPYGPGPGAYYAALPGYVPGYPPGYQAPVPGYPGGQPDFTLAGLAHLSVFFAPIILPLIVWLTQRDKSPYIARQGKQAFFWHLIFTGGTIVLVIVFYTLFFKSFDSFNRASIGNFGAFFGGLFIIWGIVLVLGIVDVVFGIIGAVKAFRGEPFSYPLLGGL